MEESSVLLQPNTRRRFLAYFAGTGLSTTLLPGVMWAKMQEEEVARVSLDMAKQSVAVAGLDFSDEEVEEMVDGINRNLDSLEEIRKFPIPMNQGPTVHFSPMVAGLKIDRARRPFRTSKPPRLSRPGNLEEMAFWPVTHLAHMLKTRKVKSVELTEMYLGRLKRYNPKLNCVVSFTDELAMKQAEQADAEIRSGNYRGPLHGIPWGCKDIISVKGYRTTWGAEDLKEQVIDVNAGVVEKLNEAGAVMIAKLATGRLAGGDNWFGGRTNNPWDINEGSSGSSAGPGSATAGGCVAFAIGTETSGSILSPSSVCGVTGLRPTFGRITRYGAMTLSWSQDRLGPMCRTAEDCAVVFNSIQGPDDRDFSVSDIPFNWDPKLDVRRLRVGYLKAGFDDEQGKTPDWRDREVKALAQMRELGIELIPFDLPDFKDDVFGSILGIESSAFFDKIPPIRTERNPNGRHRGASRLVPAVEYIQGQRIRGLMMEALAEATSDFDLYLAPFMEMRRRGGTGGEGRRGGARGGRRRGNRPRTVTSRHFGMCNRACWPAVALPTGFAGTGTPTSLTIVGKPYNESQILALAKAYQDAAGWHLKQPDLDGQTISEEPGEGANSN